MSTSTKDLNLALLNSYNDNIEACSTSCSSTDDEDENELLETSRILAGAAAKNFKKVFNRMPSNRRRCQFHRSIRRVGRLFLCLLSVPLMFLIMYIPYPNIQTRRAAMHDWSFNTSRNIADYILPDDNTTLIEPQNICQTKTFLVIVVCSSLNNFATRQTIRETWGNMSEFNYSMFSRMHNHLKDTFLDPLEERLIKYNEYFEAYNDFTNLEPVVRIVFLVGRDKHNTAQNNETLTRLHAESVQYNDIIQENFIDTYNNLTVKSVMALKWMTRHCLQNTAFFMKCDDDTFINIPNLLHILLGGTVPLYNDTLDYYDINTYKTLMTRNRMNSNSGYLAGHLFCTSRPVANISSKWYIPYYMYPKDRFPKYLSGAGYLMSIDVVPRIYDIALNTTLIYLEDVYLTGICADKINLKRRHSPLFSYTKSEKLCAFKGTVTQHEVKRDTMEEAYAFVANVSNRCPPPARYLKEFRLIRNKHCA